jgi:anti-anti-sigma regulatory factor
VPLTQKQGVESNLLLLEGTVDIACAAELKSLLIEGLGAGKSMRVSMERADSLDVTVVQLLWAAAREAKAGGVELVLEGLVPGPIQAALGGMGIREFWSAMGMS